MADAENWDEDFDGDFHALANTSVTSTAASAFSHTQNSISSRLSVHSESLAGDDDWNVVLQPNDSSATDKAMQAANQAGIPLPNGIPASALLGGTIKRLGKKKSRQKVNEDWDNDLEMGDAPFGAPLTLKKAKAPEPHEEEFDDFDDLEGSLGIRFAGTRRETGRNRSSSASAMSPSMGSITAESEDDLGGLDLGDAPTQASDFQKILDKRKATEADLSDMSQPSPAIEQPATMNTHKKSKLLSDDNDDYLNDFDLGGGDILNNRKTRMNKNLKIKEPKPELRPAGARGAAITLNFHDKPTDKPMHMRSHLPRPVSGSKPPGMSRLEPVFESGASHVPRERRQPTTTSSQLLRSKRSMPAMGTARSAAAPQKPSFIPAGVSTHNYPSHHQGSSAAQRAMPYHLRRDSDPNRQGAASPPPMRPASRLSNAFVPDTPSRVRPQRKDVAPAALAREAAAKKNFTKPARKRDFGTGNELEIFDDLPTSMTKEQKFTKEPVARGPPRPLLRQTQSRGDIRSSADPFKRNSAIPDRMMTPAPPRTPASPTKGFHAQQQERAQYTPSYLRDTAASRIARESKIGGGNARPRSQGPLQPITNWQAQIAARSPHTSPSAQRTKQRPKGERPKIALISDLSQAGYKAKIPNGMTYNPHTLRWEGNENSIAHFDVPPPLQTPTPTGHNQTSYMDRELGPPFKAAPSASPPRPALLAPMSNQAAQGVQVNGGMVFDPRQMKWLKLKHAGGESGRDFSGPLSPSVTDGEEEENPFEGIDDLKDEQAPAGNLGGSVAGMQSPVSMAAQGVGEVHEEFDLGPNFIRLQRDEEAHWRKRTEAWFAPGGEARHDDGGWRWAIRQMLPPGEAVVSPPAW